MIDKVSMDNALKRASLLETCKILPALSHIQPANFVIVRCLKSEADPFMLAEVCSIHSEDSSLKVHWWHQHHCPVQSNTISIWWLLLQTQIKNRQRGAPLWRLDPKIQTIKNNTVHFGFSKLSSDSRLPPEVLRKLRDLGLLPKTTKIKRL